MIKLNLVRIFRVQNVPLMQPINLIINEKKASTYASHPHPDTHTLLDFWAPYVTLGAVSLTYLSILKEGFTPILAQL